ncbi:hypothetical protein TPA0909_29570 [Streptomyces albus]|nr:hypothetical protein TPA0909_29570 [Streptomyces albus]
MSSTEAAAAVPENWASSGEAMAAPSSVRRIVSIGGTPSFPGPQRTAPRQDRPTVGTTSVGKPLERGSVLAVPGAGSGAEHTTAAGAPKDAAQGAAASPAPGRTVRDIPRTGR